MGDNTDGVAVGLQPITFQFGFQLDSSVCTVRVYLAVRISIFDLRKTRLAPDLPCSNNYYDGRTESHEQLFFHANWEQQTKESAVVDGTSCCVILYCLVTSIACIT